MTWLRIQWRASTNPTLNPRTRRRVKTPYWSQHWANTIQPEPEPKILKHSKAVYKQTYSQIRHLRYRNKSHHRPNAFTSLETETLRRHKDAVPTLSDACLSVLPQALTGDVFWVFAVYYRRLIHLLSAVRSASPTSSLARFGNNWMRDKLDI